MGRVFVLLYIYIILLISKVMALKQQKYSVRTDDFLFKNYWNGMINIKEKEIKEKKQNKRLESRDNKIYIRLVGNGVKSFPTSVSFQKKHVFQ